MKLYHVEQCETWKGASKAARSEFVERMRGCQYGAQETKDAWDWYWVGFHDGALTATTLAVGIGNGRP